MREPEAGTEERGRYDLYIVSENLQQEREQEEQEETGGHTNLVQDFLCQQTILTGGVKETSGQHLHCLDLLC